MSSFESPFANQGPYRPGVTPRRSPGPYRDGYELPAGGTPSSSFGPALAFMGAGLQAVGTFYALKSKQNEAKSAASSAEFQGEMSAINARAFEREAQATLEAGQQETSLRSLAAGQEQAAYRAQASAAGVEGASAAEQQASLKLAQAIDARTINMNTIRAANQSRAQAVNARNQSMLAGVSARNLRRSARSINPALGAATSLLGSLGGIGSQSAVGGGR